MYEDKICKYCNTELVMCAAEGIDCIVCKKSVHQKCLTSGTVPGGLSGDLFFTYTCKECSPTNQEVFVRDKLSWLQITVLVFYHMQTKNSGLARRGYFHWRNHIVCFIEKNWDILFKKFMKKKKKLQGTIAGVLSHFSTFFFQSGTAIFNEPAWWALTYPRLTPGATSFLYSIFSSKKQKLKVEKSEKISDVELFQKVLSESVKDTSLLTRFALLDPSNISDPIEESSFSTGESQEETQPLQKSFTTLQLKKKKRRLPTFKVTKKAIANSSKSADDFFADSSSTLNFTALKMSALNDNTSSCSSSSGSIHDNNICTKRKRITEEKEQRLLDAFCYYNTSIRNISKLKGVPLKSKLLGGIRHELILSPYSGKYLKPYIMIDKESFPVWLKLMAQIKLRYNLNKKDYVLQPRAPLCFAYVQPEHIPAINSLCNQFFWPGIDLTESLQYPEFSCVVLYKRLVVGFAFLVPDVSYTENYISFLFTRPGWRNVGIGKFMIYHLIQTSPGKDITLHVSASNPALVLYQKFGFKVERFDHGFYDKYITDSSQESKNAFFCRLERSVS